MSTKTRRVRPLAFLIIAAALAACEDAPTAPRERPPEYDGFPGFDISIYPGDAALNAWKRPSSPYHWVGYYLAAPCHRDSTWLGRHTALRNAGWGTAIIYVGQQDWRYIPNRLPSFSRAYALALGASAATCSSSLLTAEQGMLEGEDAATKTAREQVSLGSTIFLDVEYVSSVDPALTTYVRAWVRAVLEDGRYRAGIYTARSNALAIRTAALQGYADAGRSDAPAFWIAATSSSLGFSLYRHPTDVGYDFASVWQGRLDVPVTWNGITLRIDENVASTPSPS